jgi:uncharacterized protein
MAETGDVTIADNRAQNRFVATVGGADEEEGELVYALDADRLILVHTGVPEQLSGHGIGGQLVQAALERAEQEHLTVVPWCPYARHWLREHGNEAARVKVDWTSQPPPR